MVRILLADDDATYRAVIGELLRDHGYEVVLAEDGRVALDAASANPPDLLLLDVLMPVMGGFDVCKALKRDPKTAHLPVLFLSVKSESKDRVEGLHLGASDFLTKPLDSDEFLARVETCLRIHRLERELLQRNRELDELLAMQRMLVDMLVHDLKQPLHSLVISLDLVNERKTTATPEELERLIRKGRSFCDRLSSMIQQILALQSLEEGRLEPKRAPVQLRALLESCLETARAGTRIKEARVELDCPDGLPPLQADESLLARVLDNLLGNAARYVEGPGLVRIGVEAKGKALLLTVSDNGPGVPADLRERIFDKYFKTDSGRTRGGANFGLGLAFCKLAVSAHGGRLWVEDNPGGGARFCFTLPL